MRYIFSQFEIDELDIADGIQGIIVSEEMRPEFYSSIRRSISGRDLGIEEYVAKIIIDAVKRSQQNISLPLFLNPRSRSFFHDFVLG
jgi:hypothetical protein